LSELLATAEGACAWTRGLTLAQRGCLERGLLVVADPRRSFYPPAAGGWGVELARTLVLRPRVARATLSAVVQALRCPAVGAVIGWFDALTGADGRRLQLAAEAGGGLGVLLRPGAAAGRPAF